MALVSSVMMPLGTKAPDFSLVNVVNGETISLASFAGKKALLVMFICSHCPYVQHVKSELAKIGSEYKNQDIAIVAISANDAKSYPDDAPESLKEMAKAEGFTFPFLYDETQAVAKSYSAACTPDFFLFDRERMLVYRGQLDDSRPGNNSPINGKDLRSAIDAVLSDKPVSERQLPSAGCSIKWIEENEPPYASH